jgi:hypothetical protein
MHASTCARVPLREHEPRTPPPPRGGMERHRLGSPSASLLSDETGEPSLMAFLVGVMVTRVGVPPHPMRLMT